MRQRAGRSGKIRAPCSLIVVGGAAMGGVFDNLEIVDGGESADSVHIADLAAIMDRDNRGDVLASSERRFYLLLSIGNVEVEIPGLAIREDGFGAEVTNDFGCGGEGH